MDANWTWAQLIFSWNRKLKLWQYLLYFVFEICRSILKIQDVKVVGSLHKPYGKCTYDPLIFLLSVHVYRSETYLYRTTDNAVANISYRGYAMTLQLWHPVFSSCFYKFQQNLQEVLSKFWFTISNENELCPDPIGIHGIKNENWEFLKFTRNFISFLSEIPKNMLSVCQALW